MGEVNLAFKHSSDVCRQTVWLFSPSYLIGIEQAQDDTFKFVISLGNSRHEPSSIYAVHCANTAGHIFTE